MHFIILQLQLFTFLSETQPTDEPSSLLTTDWTFSPVTNSLSANVSHCSKAPSNDYSLTTDRLEVNTLMISHPSL